MSTKKQPPPPVLKLKTLNKGLKLAEQWVKNMPGQAGEEPGQLDMEGRPAGLGLGAKVLPRSHLGPSNDPLERKIMRHLGVVGKKKPVADEETKQPAKGLDSDDDDDDENLESRTNAFAKKRSGPQLLMPPPKKKSKR
ncbi:uncharacterized protein LOC141647206 [Silene latifolia]|uniref:uncharacterized protein LOC141647206 n=1 Tax=Silene latifolia TaxID=37657 RepID=UPI003D77B72D